MADIDAVEATAGDGIAPSEYSFIDILLLLLVYLFFDYLLICVLLALAAR
jgi:hypothetical protein